MQVFEPHHHCKMSSVLLMGEGANDLPLPIASRIPSQLHYSSVKLFQFLSQGFINNCHGCFMLVSFQSKIQSIPYIYHRCCQDFPHVHSSNSDITLVLPTSFP